jgi:endonuclease/exonuclease/phosphatase family metal-dependent hydrolase
VAVISVHFKCCGYTGSWQDEARVYQAQQLADKIRGLRKGEFGDKCRKAGIVVIGDYNLVGSRKPLDILKRVGLTDLLLRSAADGTAYTWRGITKDESFWPGRLDLLMYDRSFFKPSMGMIVDTTRLSSSTLCELTLNARDSLASDHLMLVADFQLVR